ncbi:hypothetical protein WA171_006552 [Blastocystis sp. BT1]
MSTTPSDFHNEPSSSAPFDETLIKNKLNLETEVISVHAPTSPDSTGDDGSDSTDGSYEIEPTEETKRPVHITVTLKNPTPVTVPILKGRYYQDNRGAFWTGKWGMGSAGKINGITSDFVYSIKRPEGAVISSEPISGVYGGYFWIKFNPPRKIAENRMHIVFTPKDGKYLVGGAGSNRLGPYELQGTYNPETQEMVCTKIYKVDTVKKRPEGKPDGPKETRASSRLLSYISGNSSDIPSTVPTAVHACYRLHAKLMHHKWAGPFLQPVDPVALHIPDYFDIIKNPMDFGTIQGRFLDGSIHTEDEYLSLVRLVFDNAVLYNKATDDVTIMAKTLSDFFEREYARIQQIGSILDSDPSTILTRRRSIKRTAYDSYGLSSQYRQYALRRSGSVDPIPKKPVSDLPSDLNEAQYCELEKILRRIQDGLHQVVKK